MISQFATKVVNVMDNIWTTSNSDVCDVVKAGLCRSINSDQENSYNQVLIRILVSANSPYAPAIRSFR